MSGLNLYAVFREKRNFPPVDIRDRFLETVRLPNRERPRYPLRIRSLCRKRGSSLRFPSAIPEWHARCRHNRLPQSGGSEFGLWRRRDIARAGLIVERLPDAILAVDGDRECNFHGAHGIFHVHGFLLERKFRRVHAQDDKACSVVFFRPTSQVGHRPDGVDAGVRPEINQRNFSAQRFPGHGG